MQTLPLYRYVYDWYIEVTPYRHNPDDPQYASRITADDGKMMQKDDICTFCVDTQNEGWNEVDMVDSADILGTYVDLKFN